MPRPSEQRPAWPLALIIWAALGIALNIGAARFTYGVMLPSLRRDLSLDYLVGGVLNAVHLLGYLIGTLVAPSLARRSTMARFSMCSYAVVTLGAVICASAPQTSFTGPLVLGLGRLITGLGAGGGIMAVMVIAFAAVSAERRALVSAVVWSGMGVATIASGLAAPLLLESAYGWRTAFAASAVLALLIAIFFPPRGTEDVAAAQPVQSAGLQFDTRQLLAGQWIYLLAAYFMFAFGYIAWSTFAGARLAATSAPPGVVQATWIIFGAATMVGAALTVPLSRSNALRHYALFVSFILAAPGAFLSALDGGSAAMAGALLVGLGAGATPTIVSTYARDRCRAEDYARIFSFAAAALGVGQLIGPVVAGQAADLFGAAAAPLLAAIAYGLGAALSILDAGAAKRTR